jgi:DNA polymerase III delta prime subunit
MTSNENIDLRYTQIPWTEKHRPYTLNEIVIPEDTKKILTEIIKTQDMPNIILSGPSGTGKTSAIKAIALSLYGKYYNEAVMELNLLDDRGIKFMQGDVLSFCKTKIAYKKQNEQTRPKYKLIIFDEADNIIGRVQDQISNIMEKYPNNVRFAFTCNMPSEINEAIQSKCILRRYTYLENDLVVDRLKIICRKENVKYDENALKKISELSRGDVRSSINKLQILYNSYNEITIKNVESLYSSHQEVIIKRLFDYIIEKNLCEAFKIIFDFKNNSFAGSDITASMLTTIRSDICNDIPQNTKIKLCQYICNGRFSISNTDSDIQLAGCIIDMIKVV